MDARKINIDGRPFRGAKDAKVTVAFFDDFQCPYSAQMYRTLVDDVMKDYRDRVKLVPVDTPRWRIHPWATHAAVNANCLSAQSNDAYWDFSSFVHQHQAAIGDDGASAELDRLALDRGERYQLDSEQLHGCIQAQADAGVKDSLQIAADAGVTDVPVLLINNQRLIGAVPAANVRQLIDYVLHRVGQSDSVSARPTATQQGVKSGSAEPDFSLPRSSLDITPPVNTLDSNVFAHGRANGIETATSVCRRRR